MLLTNGSVQLTLFSQSGRTHFIEASTDPQHWIAISTNITVGTAMPILLQAFTVGLIGFSTCASPTARSTLIPPCSTTPAASSFFESLKDKNVISAADLEQKSAS